MKLSNPVKYLKIPELIAALCFLLFLTMGYLSRISINDVTFTQFEKSEKVSLPLARDIPVDEPFFMDFDVSSPYNFSYDMWIIPDDCADEITVGSNSINLSNVRNHCNFSSGFTLANKELAPYRQSGKTHYTVKLRNGGGPGGFMVFVKMNSIIGWSINVLAIISFAMFFVFLARRFRFGKTLLVLFFLGIVFRTIFFTMIPYKVFSMDVEGHISYVQYIIEKHDIPGDKDCWSCYHPPVYYVAAAPFYMLGETLGLPGTTGLQSFSLLISVLTTFFGLLFLQNILQGRALVLSSALWIFWPLMIMVAPRIGNDQLFYLLHVLCMWAGISYFKKGLGRYLIAAVVSSALALWTKSTGSVSLCMVFVFAVGRFFTADGFRKPSKSEVVAWIMFALVAVAFVAQKVFGSELVGNAGALNSAMRVPNEAFNYLFFDLRNFLENPFTHGWDSSMGRDYFWNFALKSSLFGEWIMLQTPAGRILATVISVLLLGIIVYAIRGFWKTRLGFVHWVLLLQGAAFIAALMALRIKYPFACSSDFRYIVPALLSFTPFVAWGVTLKESSANWKAVGYTMVFAFIVSSAALYIMVM